MNNSLFPAALMLVFGVHLFAQNTPIPVPSKSIEDSEYQVVASVVARVHITSKTKWFYISNLTTSFESNPPTNNGLLISGGNGMRSENQSPQSLYSELESHLPKMTPELFMDLYSKTQTGFPVEKKLPLPLKQEIWGPTSTSELPKELGTPDFAIYHSRVGFSKDQKFALVYVASTSWVDISKSGGGYIVLEHKDSKWIILGRYQKWSLLKPA